MQIGIEISSKIAGCLSTVSVCVCVYAVYTHQTEDSSK